MNIHRMWLGLDISAASFDASFAEEGAAPDLRRPVQAFPRTPEGVQACLAWAGSLEGVALESTGIYSQEAAGWLREARLGLRVCVVNPMQVKAYGRSLAVRNKNDAVDARVIALFAASHRPKASWVPEPERMRLRDLLKERASVVQMLANERKRGFSEEGGLLADVRKQLREALQAALKRLEEGIRELVNGHPSLHRDVQRLMTIPGVALIVSTTMLALLGDLRRFARGRELAAYAGLSPSHRTSGTSIHGRTRMCKLGNRKVRHVLYLAAMTATRYPGPLKDAYEAMVARGKNRKSALGAVMRRMLLLMRALLVSEADHQATGKPRPAA